MRSAPQWRTRGGALAPDAARAGCCALAIALLVLAPFAAHAGVKVLGDPDATGIISIDCSVRIVDQALSTAAMARALHDSTLRENDILCQPWIVRTDLPGRRIGPRKQGELFFFSGLDPGTYRLDVLVGNATEAALHGHGPASTIRTLEYVPEPDGVRQLTVKLSAGDVVYLGRMTVFDTRFQGGTLHVGDEPPVRTVLSRRFSDAIQSFELLARASRRSAWEARLAEMRRFIATQSLPDTTYEW